jgi:hypothetical protein
MNEWLKSRLVCPRDKEKLEIRLEKELYFHLVGVKEDNRTFRVKNVKSEK